MPASPVQTDVTPYDDGALYDLFFERLDYGLAFYLDLARSQGSPVLDVACGTGRVLLPMLEAGIDVDGVDLFPAMIERLREKAAARGFHPPLYQSDMASFRLPRKYALVVIPFNAFIHNLTTEAQLGTLRSCKEHLLPGGMLAFDTYFPGPGMLAASTGTRELELEIKHPQTALPVRHYDTRSFDRVGQLQFSKVEIEWLDESGNVSATHTSFTTLRWIYKLEMELLLRLAGFARFEIYENFERQPLTSDDKPMIVQAWNDPK